MNTTMNPLLPVLVDSLRRSLDPYNPSKENLSKNKRAACIAAILRVNSDFVEQYQSKTFSNEYKNNNNNSHCKNNLSSNGANILSQISSDIAPFDILYILRAERAGDRWSGHVGFPGGRCETNETLLKCVIREVYEEIGINLNNELKYQFIGCLKRIDMSYVKSPQFVQPFVFLQISNYNHYDINTTNNSDPPMTLSKKEVSDVNWINLSHFTTLSVHSNDRNNNYNDNEEDDESSIGIGIDKDRKKNDLFEYNGSRKRNSSKNEKNIDNSNSEITFHSGNRKEKGSKNLNDMGHQLRSYLNNNIKYIDIEFVYEVSRLSYVLPAQSVKYPAIILDCPNSEVKKEWILWGLTYRVTGDLLNRLHYRHFLKLNKATNRSSLFFQAFGQLPMLGIHVKWKFQKLRPFNVTKLKKLKKQHTSANSSLNVDTIGNKLDQNENQSENEASPNAAAIIKSKL